MSLLQSTGNILQTERCDPSVLSLCCVMPQPYRPGRGGGRTGGGARPGGGPCGGGGSGPAGGAQGGGVGGDAGGAGMYMVVGGRARLGGGV